MAYPSKPTGNYSLRDYDFAQADSKKIPMDEYLFKNGYKNAEESETESVPDAHSQNWLFDILHRNLKYAIGTAEENKSLITTKFGTSGGTLTGDVSFSNVASGSYRGIKGTVGTNDGWRLAGSSVKDNDGYLEIATKDDGNEPIYLRQYTGDFATVKRTATLLDGSGNTSFPGSVTATSFNGTATKATQDGNGNVITSTYIPVSNKTNSITSGSTSVLTSGGAYTNLVKRKSTTEATGSASQGVYIDATGTIQPCTAVTSTYSSTSNAPINGIALNSAISPISTDVSSVKTTTNTLNALNFTYKNLSIGVGTTSLSSYLPNDGKAYLVWLYGYMHGTDSGSSYYATVKTDRLSTATGFIQLDGDSGRAQRTRVLTCVPVGSGRTITIAVGDTPDDHSYALRGYCRI